MATMATTDAPKKPILVDVMERPITDAEREFVATVTTAVEALNDMLGERMVIRARIDLMCGCCDCGAHLGAFVSFTALGEQSLCAALEQNSAENILARFGAIRFCRVHLRADRQSADGAPQNPMAAIGWREFDRRDFKAITAFLYIELQGYFAALSDAVSRYRDFLFQKRT